MNKLLFISLLLIVASCNPLKKIAKDQAAIKSLTDAAIINRLPSLKDSTLFIPGKKDTSFLITKDSNIVTKSYFYHSTDTVKIITVDNLQVESLREQLNLIKGYLNAMNEFKDQWANEKLHILIAIGIIVIVFLILVFLKFKIL